MSTLKLRKEVIDSLANVDEHFLRMLHSLLKSYKENKIDTFDNLPIEIQELIVQSRESVKQGNVFSHKDVMDQSRRKYNITA